MSKGNHWEWRVFGTLTENERKRIETRCSESVREKIMSDEYLWRDASRSNVKIRKNKLKFKQLIKTTADGCQLWREDDSLKFKFPLKYTAIELLERDLNVKAPPFLKFGCMSSEELKNALSLFKPSLKLFCIRKHRFLYQYAYRNTAFHLEISQILSPLQLSTVCIETPGAGMQAAEEQLNHFRDARDSLDLPDTMQVMGYVELLGQIDQGNFPRK
jgi:hypothetical protein